MRYSLTSHNSRYSTLLSGLWFLSALAWDSHATTIQNCLNSTNTMMINASKIAEHTNDGKMLLLYEADTPLDWCSAYHQCQRRESSLIVISESEMQKQMKILLANASDLNETAWISARRKDYGMGWTWVTNPVSDCDTQQSDFNCSRTPGDKEYGSLLLDVSNDVHRQFNVKERNFKNYLCTLHGESTDQASGWFNAQNICYEKGKGARLATFGEIGDRTAEVPTQHYNGLQYRPWVWITDSATGTPMIYSNWSDTNRALYSSGKECLIMNVTNGYWEEKQCEASLRHFICEETIQPPTTEGSTTSYNQFYSDSSNDGGAYPITPGSNLSLGGLSREEKIGLAVGIVLGIAVLVAIVLGVYFGVFAKKRKKNGSVSDMDNGKVNEGLDMQNETGEERRTDGYGSNGFPSIANNNVQSHYDEINDPKQSSKNTPAPNTAPPPKPPRVEPDPAYTLATDPKKQVNIVGNPYIISPYSEVELNQLPTRNALDDNRGSRIMVDNTMYGGTIDHEPKQKPGILNKPPPGKPKAPEKPPKPTSLKKPQVAAITPVRHTLGPEGDEYAEIQKVDTIKK